MKPIVGHSDLKRDDKGVIHNVNKSALEAAKRKKQRETETIQRVQNLENEINEMKNILNEMLMLIKRQ